MGHSMRLKDASVSVRGLETELVVALFDLDMLWRKMVGYELIITSARDGRHKRASQHYKGDAVDIRTWTTESSGTQLSGENRRRVYQNVTDYLGPDFIVIDERDHLHIHYRPLSLEPWKRPEVIPA